MITLAVMASAVTVIALAFVQTKLLCVSRPADASGLLIRHHAIFGLFGLCAAFFGCLVIADAPLDGLIFGHSDSFTATLTTGFVFVSVGFALFAEGWSWLLLDRGGVRGWSLWSGGRSIKAAEISSFRYSHATRMMCIKSVTGVKLRAHDYQVGFPKLEGALVELKNSLDM